jgi:hypothetical protein
MSSFIAQDWACLLTSYVVSLDTAEESRTQTFRRGQGAYRDGDGI